MNTRYGFILGIVVGLDSIDATCILLEPVKKDDATLLTDHSLVVVNRAYILPCSFADSDTGQGSTRH